MEDNKLVSVIIPNYNNGKYITQCIESIEMQTYHPIEIIVVDDVSTDDSRDIIRSLQKKHDNITTVFLEKNGGVSNARNIGAEKSTGEYVCFIDPDDFFYAEDKIENEMKIIKQFLDEGKKVIAFSGVACVNEQGQYVENRGLSGMLEGNIVVPYLARYKSDKHPRNEIVDKEAFIKAGGFDTTMSFWEDDDLFIRILFEREIYFTGKMGTAYRWKTTGLSHQTILKSENVIKELQKKYYKRFSLRERVLYHLYILLTDLYEFKRINIPRFLHQGSVIKHKLMGD